MRLSPLPWMILATAALAFPASAQTGTLDQFSPFSSEVGGTGASGASYNFSAPSLTWQLETVAGYTGQLEGFELEFIGPAGASANFDVILGPAWQTGTPVWSGSYAKTTSSTEVVFFDLTASNIMLTAGDSYVIQVLGNDDGLNGSGSYKTPLNDLYPLPLYLNGSEFLPEWKIGFHTYMLTGPSLSLSGVCGSSMTFDTSGMTAGGAVAFLWAFGQGSYVIPNGPCAGTMLGLDATVRNGGIRTADPSGMASLTANVPSSVCGRIFVQALDAATCTVTNVLLVQ